MPFSVCATNDGNAMPTTNSSYLDLWVLCVNNSSMHISCSTFHSRRSLMPWCGMRVYWRRTLLMNIYFKWLVASPYGNLRNDVAWSVPTLKLVQMTGCNASATIDSQIHRIRLNSNVAARKQNALISHSRSRSLTDGRILVNRPPTSAWVEFLYFMAGKYF